MDRLAGIQVFAQVVESGGFAKAAARLGLSTTATSRHVAELEAHLQTRLLNRTTRRVSLTESGQAFYGRAVQILADLAEAEQEAARAAIVPRGTIKVTSSHAFAVRHVAGAIAAFLGRHPEGKIHMSPSQRILDLLGESLHPRVRIRRTGTGKPLA